MCLGACVGDRVEDEAAAVVPRILLDNDEPGWEVHGSAILWAKSTALKNVYGGYHREAPGGKIREGRFENSAGTAEWNVVPPTPGRYFVHVWIPVDPANTPVAKYEVQLWAQRAGSNEIVFHQNMDIDQRVAGPDYGWTLLTDVQVERGDKVQVSLHPHVSDPGRVVADAVRLTYASRPLRISSLDPCGSPWATGAACLDEAPGETETDAVPAAPLDCSMVPCEWCDGLDANGPCCADDREDPETCPTW